MPPIAVSFFDLSHVAFWMCLAGLALLLIGAFGAKHDLAHAHGLNRLVALATLCFAVPLAVFGSEHFTDSTGMLTLVPRYMPWRLFWVYFVGAALIAASLSIATRTQVRWSGTLVGIMMLMFVAMLYVPSALRTGNRFTWIIVFRESSFGGGGLVLAGTALGGLRGRGNALIAIGRVLIGLAAVFFGVQHLLHPLGVPVVPLAKQIPGWVPFPLAIDYLTGAFLLIAGVCFLTGWKTRAAAARLGLWIGILLLAIYGPILAVALASPTAAVQVEGINYFADTLLFGGAILALARATPVPSKEPDRR